MNQKYLISALISLLSIAVVSCQSPEQKAAEARKKEIETARAEKEQQIKALISSTPDIYRVSWKVCQDKKVNLARKFNGGCDEAKEPTTQGFQEPLFMWGPIGQVQVDQKTNPISPGVIYATAFIKSRGCLTSGTPKNEQLYKVRGFVVDKNAPVTSSNIKAERLSKEEKESKIRQQVANVELTRDYQTLGLLGGDDCQSFNDWEKNNSNS
ncbi:hypothetical protein [Dendronalium sp. ChiSLP03b]|uniref:hypothetical protein n=1 Tax=Dendronalium sp. ChiSLP03b TaxID=3075381 RepID=UPI002AD1DCED|nr:hypothetical protein [Dendronalium sp. ChiSLP03b]MDZ8203517.1 hypothetical protein [Dendronalium sp. ChiSLP03b]